MDESVNFNNILTHEQCIKLIKQKIKSKDFQLLSYTIKPISAQIKGFCGSHLRGNFNILRNGKTESVKFFFKLKFDDTNEISTSKLLTEDNDVYLRESEFLKLVTTKYHAEWAPQFYDFVNGNLLALEDLTERGFKLAEVDGYDLNHCKVGLQTLARYHAFSFKFFHDRRQDDPDYSVLKEYPFFFQEVAFQKDTEAGINWTQATKDSLLYLHEAFPQKNAPNAEIRKTIIQKIDHLCDDLKPVENRYHILSHGDLWGNNIMFSYENGVPQKCCLIDFQVIRYLPPAMDVQFFLMVNSSPSVRQKHNRELLEYYYEQLTQELQSVGLDVNEVYPKDIFASTCKSTIFSVLIIACCYKSLLLMNRDKMNEYMLNPEIGDEFMYGDRVKFIKIELENDANYKTKMLEQFQVLIDEIIEQL